MNNSLSPTCIVSQAHYYLQDKIKKKNNLRNIGKTVFFKLPLQINEDDISLLKRLGIIIFG